MYIYNIYIYNIDRCRPWELGIDEHSTAVCWDLTTRTEHEIQPEKWGIRPHLNLMEFCGLENCSSAESKCLGALF